MMQTQIPRGLQALMQASQVLSSQASPSAPGPQGPQPTVAERVNQQIKQMSRPQAPEGGIMGLPPGLKDIGQQAGIAGQIMAQRQAQQQQMAQDPEAVAQMAAKMVRGQGVDQLPVNMGFKEGGIIGFQGEGRSDVPEASTPATVDEIRKRLVAAVKSGDMNAVRLYQRQLAEAQQTSAPEQGMPPALNVPQNIIDPNELRSKMAEAVRSRDVTAAQGYARQLASLSGQGQVPSDDGRRVTIPTRLNQPVAATAAPTQEPTALEPITSEPPLPTRADRLPSSPSVGIDHLLQSRAKTPPSAPAPRPTAPTKPAVTEPTPAAAAAPAEPTIDTSGIKPIDISKGIDQLAPSRAKGQIERLQKLEDERATTKASLFDEFEAGIKALEKDKEMRKQLLKSKEERDNFNRMMAFFQDLRTKGNQYGSVDDAIFARNEAERLADLAHDKAVIELRRAKKADQLGDIDRKIAFEDKATGLFKAEDALRVQAAQVTSGAEQERFRQESETARTAATIRGANARNEADLAQRDRALQANLNIERQKIEGLRQDRSQAAQYNALNAALGKYNAAYETYRKVREDNKANLMLPEDSKDPTVKAARQRALDAVNDAWKTLVEPAKNQYDAISNQVLKGYATTPAPAGNSAIPASQVLRFDSKGNPIK